MKLDCTQTVLLRRRPDGGLDNLLRIAPDAPVKDALLTIDGAPAWRGDASPDSPIEAWIPEPTAPTAIGIRLAADGAELRMRMELRVPRHWQVHLVQMSHHDPGYTDLMSHVAQRHYEWIDRVLDDMDAREDYPDDVRLRVCIEQFWSMDCFLARAPQERIAKAMERIRRGDIELTALYGNLITEQLGAEECYRALYPAQELAARCGVTITSALHNDVPGVSWGICRALCDAGIRFFAPDFPNYYDWGHAGLESFWRPEAVLGYKGPGAMRWVSPDGKSLLMWHGDGGWGCDSRLPHMESDLLELEQSAYPYDLLRKMVTGSTVDNSPLTPDFADYALKWNAQYAYPHIIISTNERFRAALERRTDELGLTIPELRGDMPGQDYPVAAMSMAAVTSAARKTHGALTAAEKLLTLVSGDPKVYDQRHLLREAYRDLLLADDHAYGYHFPAGPAMRASYWEKGTYAMRAEANAHDLMDKALASVCDRIAPMGSALRLTAFNPSGRAGRAAVTAPLRELDNCGTIVRKGNRNPHVNTGYILNDRRHVSPEADIWRDGLFDLVDMNTGRSVPYFIDDIDWDSPMPYAPERCGLAQGGRRYGFFELPGGMRRMLCFMADDLPAFGYRCYALMPRDTSPALPAPTPVEELDTGIYRIRADARGICSITDLRDGAELLDSACPHRLGELLMRVGREERVQAMRVTRVDMRANALRGTVDVYGELEGAHEVRVRLTAWQGEERLELAVHLLHSARPLQSVFMAFPFAGSGFRYEGMLCELEPVRDFVPGAQSDLLTVGSYVSVGESGVMWSPLDTGVVSLGQLRTGYVSPAHSCIFSAKGHRTLTEVDFMGTGWIYSMLTANNFGTNFMCSQAFDGVYRYTFGRGSCAGDAQRALWGESAMNPVLTQFTDRSRGELPPAASLLDAGGMQCLALKRAEDGEGFIARLWNHSDEAVASPLTVCGRPVTGMTLCDALERPTGEALTAIPPRAVVTVRLNLPCAI